MAAPSRKRERFLVDMNSPIGIFDSGVGGTSIWKEVRQLLPLENTFYLADSANAPYGEKSEAAIRELSIKNTELLLQKGCKLIIVACNTATTNAIALLRKTYDVPFIGIEPAIKPAALSTKTKKVGVLATKGTLASHLFHNTAKLHATGIDIIEREGKGLVELIEAGKVDTDDMRALLSTHLAPMLQEGIDCLVLGCTHYSYLIPLLQELLPNTVQIIDSGEAVARQTKAVLVNKKLLAKKNMQPEHIFWSNKNVAILKQFIPRDAANTIVEEHFF